MSQIIRLKHLNRDLPCTKLDLARLAYGKLNVPFTRIFTTNEGFKAICRNENDADRILNNEATKELEKIGLQVMVPYEMKIKRSIFIKKLDHIIGEHSPEEIKEEIEKENRWIKITEVTKIKNYTNIMKIRLEDTKMVEKAKQQGILAYNLAITPDQIEQEEYVDLTTCYKCYELENHQTKDCPYTNLTICSECGEQGHTFRNCPNETKQCINCLKLNQPANHRTLAWACPIRKKKIKDKIDENKQGIGNNEQMTYAEIAKRAVEQARTPGITTQITLSEHKHTKILISIMHAHIMNLSNPGTYQRELNVMLQKNDLPTMWFPDNPDSGRLLGATFTNASEDLTKTYSQTTTEAHDEPESNIQVTQTPETYNRDPRLEGRSRRQETGTKQITRSSSKQRTEHIPTTETYCTPTGDQYPEHAEEIGLKIYATSKHIIPTINPHNEHILQQIRAGNFKWTYTDPKYEEDTIRRLISMNKIKITKNEFKRIDEGSFRKIRNGQLNRSPPEESQKTKK